MASADDGMDVVEEAEEVEELKLRIKRAKLQLYYVVLAWFAANLLLLITLMFINVIAWALPTPKLVSMNPFIVGFTENGVPLTQAVNTLVILEVIRNSITLYYKGLPSIAIETDQIEAEAND